MDHLGVRESGICPCAGFHDSESVANAFYVVFTTLLLSALYVSLLPESSKFIVGSLVLNCAGAARPPDLLYAISMQLRRQLKAFYGNEIYSISSILSKAPTSPMKPV